MEQRFSLILPESEENLSRSAPGEANIDPRGTPAEVPKSRSRKKVPQRGSSKPLALNGSPNLKLCSVVGDRVRCARFILGMDIEWNFRWF